MAFDGVAKDVLQRQLYLIATRSAEENKKRFIS